MVGSKQISNCANKIQNCLGLGKTLIFVLSVWCYLAVGCTKDNGADTRSGAITTNAFLSLKLLDGVVATRTDIQVNGERVEATILPKDLGQSALFLCYYTLPMASEDKRACDAAIDAEIARCVANTAAVVISRKVIPSAKIPTTEVVAKSPNKKSHSIRFRVLCTGKQIQSLTAVTPDDQSSAYAQALDDMFEEFNAK